MIAIDEFAASVGLSFEGDEGLRVGKGTRRRYRAASGEELQVSVRGTGKFCQFLLSALSPTFRQSITNDELCRLLRQLCERAAARLGRTFGESWHGVILEAELHGDIEWVDWFQYWNAEVTARFGLPRTRLRSFHLVEEAEGGGCALWLTADPDDPGQEERRGRVGRELGIALRPYPGVGARLWDPPSR